MSQVSNLSVAHVWDRYRRGDRTVADDAFDKLSKEERREPEVALVGYAAGYRTSLEPAIEAMCQRLDLDTDAFRPFIHEGESPATFMPHQILFDYDYSMEHDRRVRERRQRLTEQLRAAYAETDLQDRVLWICHAQLDPDKRAAAVERCLRDDLNDIALYALAKALERDTNHQALRATCLDRAIVADPAAAIGYLLLADARGPESTQYPAVYIHREAVAAFATGDYETALAKCRRAEELDDAWPGLEDTMAFAAAQMGEPQLLDDWIARLPRPGKQTGPFPTPTLNVSLQGLWESLRDNGWPTRARKVLAPHYVARLPDDLKRDAVALAALDAVLALEVGAIETPVPRSWHDAVSAGVAQRASRPTLRDRSAAIWLGMQRVWELVRTGDDTLARELLDDKLFKSCEDELKKAIASVQTMDEHTLEMARTQAGIIGHSWKALRACQDRRDEEARLACQVLRRYWRCPEPGHPAVLRVERVERALSRAKDPLALGEAARLLGGLVQRLRSDGYAEFSDPEDFTSRTAEAWIRSATTDDVTWLAQRLMNDEGVDDVFTDDETLNAVIDEIVGRGAAAQQALGGLRGDEETKKR